MAAYLAGHGQLARQLASPCHGKAPLAGRRENPRAYRRSRAVLYEASRTSRLHAVPACQFGPAMTEFFTPSALWWPRHTIDAKPDSLACGELLLRLRGGVRRRHDVEVCVRC